MPLLASLIIALVVSLVALVFIVYSLVALLRDRVPYVATPGWVIKWLVANAALSPSGKIYDLGCGDGRVLRALKKNRPRIRAVGLERNWWPYLVGRLRARGSGVVIRRKNFYQADLRDADAVYCYLLDTVMPRISVKLRRELKPGAQVYSYAFRLPDWQPIEVIPNPAKPKSSKLLVYRV